LEENFKSKTLFKKKKTPPFTLVTSLTIEKKIHFLHLLLINRCWNSHIFFYIGDIYTDVSIFNCLFSFVLNVL